MSVKLGTSLHVAFLRGVGWPKPARGDALKACLGAAGYDRIRPVMATGNVIFGLGRKRKPPEEAVVSALIAEHFGYPLPAILRPADEVASMVSDDPFRGVDQERLTRFVALARCRRAAGLGLSRSAARRRLPPDRPPRPRSPLRHRPRGDQDAGPDGEAGARVREAAYYAELEHNGKGRRRARAERVRRAGY